MADNQKPEQTNLSRRRLLFGARMKNAAVRASDATGFANGPEGSGFGQSVDGQVDQAIALGQGIEITQACLAVRNVACRSCDDHCPEQAIKFRPQLGGHYHPAIDLELCTFCGACAKICPSAAIVITVDAINDEVPNAQL